MGKALAIIAGILGLLSIGLFFVSPFLGSWWFATASAEYLGTTVSMGMYINAFGQGMVSMGTMSASGQVLTALAPIGAILTLLGSILVLIGGGAGKKVLVILGAVLILLGPILFIVDLMGSAGIEYYPGGGSIFFGTDSYMGVTMTWGLGPGLFMAVIGAILGLAGSGKLE